MNPDKQRTLIDVDPITESAASPYADTDHSVVEETTLDEDTENFFSEDRPPIQVEGL